MIPLLPLPNVVLFPNVFLPLHIFENRYRLMMQDALASDRIIGMVLLRGEPTAEAEPAPVYDVGCSGLITHSERIGDGRFNIVLRGFERFRITDEDHTRPYRRALVEGLAEQKVADKELRPDRQRLEQLLDRQVTAVRSHTPVPLQMADGDLVNALSQYLDLDPVEKQALLERDGLVKRCRSLIDLLEMKVLMGGVGRFQRNIH